MQYCNSFLADFTICCYALQNVREFVDLYSDLLILSNFDLPLKCMVAWNIAWMACHNQKCSNKIVWKEIKNHESF